MNSDSRITLMLDVEPASACDIAVALGPACGMLLIGTRRPQVARQTADRLSELGFSAQSLPLSITDPGALLSAADGIMAAHGRLDAVICDSDTLFSRPAPGTALANCALMPGFDVLAPVLTLLPLLERARAGRVVYLRDVWASNVTALTRGLERLLGNTSIQLHVVRNPAGASRIEATGLAAIIAQRLSEPDSAWMKGRNGYGSSPLVH